MSHTENVGDREHGRVRSRVRRAALVPAASFAALALVAAGASSQATAATAVFTPVTFQFVGAPEAITVPDEACFVDVAALGAAGGNGYNGAENSIGGGGAGVTSRFDVVPGQQLTVDVGGQGLNGDITDSVNPAGGYGGGGAGGIFSSGGSLEGGGGGGRTTVSLDGSFVVIAGGGGGGGGSHVNLGASGGAGGELGEDGSASGETDGGAPGLSGGNGGLGGVNPSVPAPNGDNGGDAAGGAGGGGGDAVADPHGGVGGGGGAGAIGGGGGAASVTNAATSGGGGGGGSSVGPVGSVYTTAASTGDGSVTVTFGACPALELVKQVDSTDDLDGDGAVSSGDLLWYGFVVTNTGDADVTGLTVLDPLLAGTGITCDDTVVPARDSIVCRADEGYTVTAADAQAGQVVNVATAHAAWVDGPVDSTEASVTTAVVVPQTATTATPTATSTGTGTGATLAQTGAEPNLSLIAVSGSLLLMGAALALFSHRARREFVGSSL